MAPPEKKEKGEGRGKNSFPNNPQSADTSTVITPRIWENYPSTVQHVKVPTWMIHAFKLAFT